MLSKVLCNNFVTESKCYKANKFNFSQIEINFFIKIIKYFIKIIGEK